MPLSGIAGTRGREAPEGVKRDRSRCRNRAPTPPPRTPVASNSRTTLRSPARRSATGVRDELDHGPDAHTGGDSRGEQTCT